jgi:type IV pilus assembly protein PilB
MSRQLQAMLRRSGALTSQELERSLVQANTQNISLFDLLVVERQVPEETLAEAFSAWLKMPRVQIDSVAVEPRAVAALAGGLARKYTCLPIRLTGKGLVLAMANPLDRQAIQDVEFASGRQVEPVVACRGEILRAIERHYAADPSRAPEPAAAEIYTFSPAIGEPDVLDLEQPESAATSPAVDLCNSIVLDAIASRASDIHVEPGPRETRVRLRVDGVLRDYLQLPRWMSAALLSRIKILAKLDIAQQRLPQDGRIKARMHDRAIDLRVSTLPTHFGEKAVLRLLGAASTPTLDSLGLSAGELAILDDALAQPQGLILVTGPTGTGKSTTLYSMLMRRRSSELNIVTIEDPIEYQVPGASQVQVDIRAGLTFASCLRAILRQDPDLIMVGEIRDPDTAEIAFQAALTGHLVFSTLHTNGSVAAVERLLDLGVKPLLLTSATNLIVAQRLARRICTSCREPYVPSADAIRRLQIEADRHEFQHGKGCAACGQTGYSGRVGIFEILRMTPRLKELVSRHATEPELRRAAAEDGTRLLLRDALDKMRQGLTTPEEILRVIRIDHADETSASSHLALSAVESARR